VRHERAHPLAGKTVRLRLRQEDVHLNTGDRYRLEDWWDRVSAGSWMDCMPCWAAAAYALRVHAADLPVDDEVVYGQVGGVSHLVHVSELGPILPDDDVE